MSISFVVIFRGVGATPAPPRDQRLSLLEPLRALRHPGLLAASVLALLYNFGFFTLLAYTPLPLKLGVHALGIVFFGWGILVAVGAVLLAPRLQRRFGILPLLGSVLACIVVDLLVIGAGVGSHVVMIPAIVISGLFLGTGNALISTLLMRVSVVDASISASATNFVRFLGGALAPFLAGKLSTGVSAGAPLYLAAAAVAAGMALIFLARRVLDRPGAEVLSELDASHAVAVEAELVSA